MSEFKKSSSDDFPSYIYDEYAKSTEDTENDRQRFTILYGSQTGTAQDVAERIWREGKKYGFNATVLPLDDYPVTNFAYEKFVVFICSTTGQGEEPDNMKTFWKILLRKSLPTDCLAHICFGVLGLGDSSYIKFNFVAKRLFKRLQQLGGHELLPIALADDQHELGIDATVDPFIESLWKEIFLIDPLPDNFKQCDDDFLCRWNVNELSPKIQPNKITNIYDMENGKSFKVTVKENVRITSKSHFQDVRLIKFKTEEVQKYSPGDVLMVRPKNLESAVTDFFNVLASSKVKLTRKTKVKLTSKYQQMPVPDMLKGVLTLEQICRDYWDLNAIPRRWHFQVLSKITPNEMEKEKFLEFTTSDGQQELYNYCNRPRRHIIEVLYDFPYACSKLTLDVLFEIMQPIRPRAFSISSSSVATPTEIHILVAVVKYKTKLAKERYGLCSNWLASLNSGDEFNVSIKNGTFKFPATNDYLSSYRPLIMIGPGTGVAPFRSYIMERESMGNASDQLLKLFFGCRNQSADHLCKEDFTRYSEQGKLTYVTAFSRDQDHKIYVQHKLLENKEMVANDLLYKDAHVFIAGNAKNMPNDVRKALIDCLVDDRKYTLEGATDFIEKMEKTGKFQTETWS